MHDRILYQLLLAVSQNVKPCGLLWVRDLVGVRPEFSPGAGGTGAAGSGEVPAPPQVPSLKQGLAPPLTLGFWGCIHSGACFLSIVRVQGQVFSSLGTSPFTSDRFHHQLREFAKCIDFSRC